MYFYHPSEHVYKQWIDSFSLCSLVENIDGKLKIKSEKCKEILNEFKSWAIKYKDIKGHSIETAIKKDIGDLPLNGVVKYEPKSPFVKAEILLQLAKNNPSQIDTIKDKENKIVIELVGTDIILTKRKKHLLTPVRLQDWLSKFGIFISSITTNYMVEYGMPYGGRNIDLSEVIYYTHRGYGVVGLLAFELHSMIMNMERGQDYIDLRFHPLRQSVILALARLEYYLNPKMV